MKLSKKQMIYGSLLAAAGVAWAIDAAFFETPQIAQGAQAANEPASVALKAAAVDVPAGGSSEHLLTTRLQHWGAGRAIAIKELPDVFQRPLVIKPVALQPPAQTRPASDPAATFRQRHHVIAIVLDSTGGFALIDGNVVRIGQTLDGAKLVHLSRRNASFSSSGILFDVPLTEDVAPTP